MTRLIEYAALVVLIAVIAYTVALMVWDIRNLRRVTHRRIEILERQRARLDVDVACRLGWHDTVLKAIEIRVARGNRRLLRVIEGGGMEKVA